MTRKLNRRRFLRGVGAFGSAAVALPLFDSAFNNNGTAMANGNDMPSRVGLWFWGNGLRPEHFFPEGHDEEYWANGTPGQVKAWDLAARQHTAPLADAGLSQYMSLITGTRVFAGPRQDHHDGKNAVLTGSYEWFDGNGDLGYAGPITPSLDQVAANFWEGLTPFKSLVLGVQEGAANNEPGNAGHFTSSTGPNTYIEPEYSPLALYERLFMPDSTGGDDLAAARLILARRSVLDAVSEDLASLNRELGPKDKMCLDQHLTAIRQLEMRLEGAAGDCMMPSTPPLDWPTIDGIQRLRDRSNSMSEILALALACDLTRAFSYQFTVFQTGHDFAQEPELNGSVPSVNPGGDVFDKSTSFHEAAHAESFQDNVRIVTNFTFSNLAYLLRLLAERPEGAGSVLTNSAILITSEHTEPVSHSTVDLPMMIAGNACGNLKGGVWYHGDRDQTKVSQAGLTVLRNAGVQLDRFGQSFDNGEGEANNDPSATETLSALEA